MQLVETTLTPLQRRAGAARIRWTDLADQQRDRGEAVRALPPGEHVVLHLGGREFHLGQVVGYLGSGADGAYVVSVGAPLSRRSGRWLGAAGNDNREIEPDVIDVEVRPVPRIPAQRSSSVSLYL